MQIQNHQLVGQDPSGSEVQFNQTQNFWSGAFRTANGLPDSIIIHYTGMTSLAGAVKVLTTKKPKDNVSAHLVVGKNGEVVQLARFDTRTWHAGTSAYNGREGYNHYSIGIEIDNVGWLKDFGEGKYSRKLLSREGIYFDKDEVLAAKHVNPDIPYAYWGKYTDAQVDAVFDLCQLLYNSYDIKEILGHDEISPGRKSDPGPAFPMDELRQSLLTGRSGETSAGFVNTDSLNIRAGAGVGHPKVAQPLAANQEVEILEEKEGWVKVRTSIEGWVSKQYISRR